ncbi:MAG: flavodoxin domain-containing protein [Candidatus Omnitrophica bacterium]|nr:flavodoxin domain-containing protein [Candidatus Omnitrophota bacterium]
MAHAELVPGVYWTGIVDWNVRTFHGYTYTTPRGSTYNAYLIIDDKITLIDAVFGPFADEFIARIAGVVDPSKIDYIIVNHVETDHSGALPRLLALCPKAKLFATSRGKDSLMRIYHKSWDVETVKTGDSLSLGKRSLAFLEAPMVHWPDSMFSYCPQEKILFSNDAFGQHYASSERFDDQTDQGALHDEAKKYYANILWPFGSVIAKKIDDIGKEGLDIRTIAPSHGIIWRKDPAWVLDAYRRWAREETRSKVVIAYETMWGSTSLMARAIAQALTEAGIEVKLYDVALTDRTQIITQMLDARGFVFGSSTHDNVMLPTMAALLHFLGGLRPHNRFGCAFGSYGWAGGAVKEIEDHMRSCGIEVAQPAVSVRYVPDEKTLSECAAFGKSFAEKIRAET